MNTLNTFQAQSENFLVLHREEMEHNQSGEHREASDSLWRRVLDVILIEGEMRYLVERTD